MNIIDEWSEIPAPRRHTYFYICLLLGTLAASNLQEPAPAAFCSREVDSLVKVIQLEDAPPLGVKTPADPL